MIQPNSANHLLIRQVVPASVLARMHVYAPCAMLPAAHELTASQADNGYLPSLSACLQPTCTNTTAGIGSACGSSSDGEQASITLCWVCCIGLQHAQQWNFSYSCLRHGPHLQHTYRCLQRSAPAILLPKQLLLLLLLLFLSLSAGCGGTCTTSCSSIGSGAPVACQDGVCTCQPLCTGKQQPSRACYVLLAGSFPMHMLLLAV
jgi:hypothetical protein